jgi:hypothetical protein
MDPSYAWLWHKSKEESLAIPDVTGRVKAMCEKQLRQLTLLVKDPRPRVLDYKKYMTKTCLISGLPDLYKNSSSQQLDEITSNLAPLVCDLIVMETEQLQRKNFLKKFKMHGDQHQQVLSQCLLRSLLMNLMPQLSSHFPHLSDVQYDENANVSVLWDRHGIKRNRRQMVKPDYYKWTVVHDQRVAAQTLLDFVLRSDKPLPEVRS